MNRAAMRFGGLAALPFLSLLVPFLALPVIARVAPSTEWAALGVGESVGAIAALIVGYGWPLVGPARVASADLARAREHFAASTTGRAVLFLLVAIPGVLLTAVLSPSPAEALGVLGFLSTALLGLSPSWYLIGRSDPRSLALFETLPRIAAGAAAIALVLTTRAAIWYPITMLVVTAVFQLLFVMRERAGTALLRWSSWRTGAAQLRADWSPAVAVVAGGAYSAGTVALVSAVGSVAVIAVFVSADKLMKASLTAIVAAVNAMQGWVAESGDAVQRRKRGHRGLAVLAMIGIVGALAIWLAGPLATGILFGAPLAIDGFTSLTVGVAFLAIALNSAIGRLLLVPLGAVAWVTWSTVVGAVLGIPGILVGTALFGVHGAASAFALSEIAVVLVQAGALAVLTRRARAASREAITRSRVQPPR